MPPPKVAPETPIEIEDVEQWMAITDKANLDMNIIDVYSEWCGPCMCLAQTYKRILFDNDETLSVCKEMENKTIKYWTACTEKMTPQTEEGAEEVPKVEGLEQYTGDPMPHLLIYLKGDLKATIDGANAPKLLKTVSELLEEFKPAQ